MVIVFVILIILVSVILGFIVLVQNPKGVDLQGILPALATSLWE